jgi:phospholipase C
MNYQLFEDYFPPEGVQPPVPSMGGFARNYYHQTIATQDPYDPRAIMHCFDPSEVPVTSQLAAAFGVSRHWFASTPARPGPTVSSSTPPPRMAMSIICPLPSGK